MGVENWVYIGEVGGKRLVVENDMCIGRNRERVVGENEKLCLLE